jgi:16S rRNA (uracil1498-N3)-methyltransferase
MMPTSPSNRIHFSGPLAAEIELGLPAAQSRHAVQVLRMAAGDRLTLFNGDGAEYDAVITRVAKGAVWARVEGVRAVSREAPLQVTLVQGMSRSERMDYTVQKAVELGVTRIEPVMTRRSVVRLDAARARQKASHWQAIAVGACEQCGRNRVPDIAPVVSLEQWFAHRLAGGSAGPGLLLDPEAARGLRDLPAPAGAVTLLAGPEGGLTGAERRAVLQAEFVGVRLGPRVLRTETAALAALAAMQALWGDF